MATDVQEHAGEAEVSQLKKTTSTRTVLYVNSWSSCHGGSSTSLIDIVSSLNSNRFRPIVLCPESGPLTSRMHELGVSCFARSISSLMRERALRFAVEVPQYIRFLKKNRIDLVHANTSCWRKSVVMAAKWAGIPFIQHVRNPISDYESDFAMKYASRIVTNSDQVGIELRKSHTTRERTQTIYNAVNLSLYDDLKDQRDEIGAGDRPIIGFVGQIVPRKGLLTLIEAMPAVLRDLPRAMLVVVGCSPPEDDSYEENCKRKITELGIDESVRFVGYRRDVPTWMATFDVFALPTRSEPFGKVIVEAMAGRCPVVTTAVGGIPEIVEDSGLGTLVEPDDSHALAQAITRFLSSPRLSAEVASQARSHVSERFGLKQMIRQLEDLYDDVLAEHKR